MPFAIDLPQVMGLLLASPSPYGTMVTIRNDNLGVAAFDSERKITMNCNRPIVQWHLDVPEMENWLTTLEEAMTVMEPHHRRGLERLYFTLKAAYGKHRAQHDEIVSEAPNADDLMAYLVAYTSAMTK